MDDYGVRNDLTTKIGIYLDLIDELADEHDPIAEKMCDILLMGRTGYCRAAISGSEEELRRVAKAYPGFTFIELRELGRRMHVRYAINRLEGA